MSQLYRLTSTDGRIIETIDEGGQVFPYEEIAQLARDNGFTNYKIELMGEYND